MLRRCYNASFYNRKTEVDRLTNVFTGRPTLTVLLGPPSSGKTALVKKVVGQQNNAGPLFHPLLINLRGISVSSPDALYETLCDSTFAFFKEASKNLTPSNIPEPFNALVNASVNLDFKIPKPGLTMAKFLRELENATTAKEWTASHGYRPTVIVDDEANAFKQMEIKTFLDFAVKISKETSKIHVILTSSDSFFEDFLIKDSRIPSSHFKTLVLGDLTYDESFDFYLNYIDEKFGNDVDTKLFSKSKNEFKKVFYMTGGRIWFIQDFINQISQTGKTIDSVLDFDPIVQEYGILTSLSRRTNVFSRKDFIAVLTKLTGTKEVYCNYDNLCEEIGDEKISALIEKNVLHFRPPSTMARDLIPCPHYNVFTATGAPALRAMELIVKSVK